MGVFVGESGQRYIRLGRELSVHHGSEASPSAVCSRMEIPTNIFNFCHTLFYFMLFYNISLFFALFYYILNTIHKIQIKKRNK